MLFSRELVGFPVDGDTMAMTPAEKQRAYRERLRSDPGRLGNVTTQNRLRKKRQRERGGNVTSPSGNVTGGESEQDGNVTQADGNVTSLESTGIFDGWSKEEVREHLEERLAITQHGGG